MSRTMFSFAPTKKTVFDVGGADTGSATSTTSTSSTCIEATYFHKLSDSISLISNIFYQYSLGNFKQVTTILTMQQYNALSQTLYLLKKSSSSYPYYENIRQTFLRCLAGILQSVNQYGILTNTKNQLAAALKKASILDDLNALRNYVKSLKGSTTIFPSATVQTIAAQITPEYSYYIKVWGYPKGGIFEMDKLAIAIQNTHF